MTRRETTLAEAIEMLTRETRAPEAFVDRIRALFEGRGIPLATSAAPYVPALENAFRRHEALRRNVARAHEDLGELQSRLEIVGSALSERAARLRAVRRSLELSGAFETVPGAFEPYAVGGSHGRLVPGDYDRPVVPGPGMTC